MSKWFYKPTETNLFTVGYETEDGQWHPDSDHTTQEKAANRVHFLNGGIDLSNLMTRQDFAVYLDLWNRQNKVFAEFLVSIAHLIK